MKHQILPLRLLANRRRIQLEIDQAKKIQLINDSQQPPKLTLPRVCPMKDDAPTVQTISDRIHQARQHEIRIARAKPDDYDHDFPIV